MVVDVGNRIELYSEPSRSGATYTHFPDPRSHRIALADLQLAEGRERLRRIRMVVGGTCARSVVFLQARFRLPSPQPSRALRWKSPWGQAGDGAGSGGQ